MRGSCCRPQLLWRDVERKRRTLAKALQVFFNGSIVNFVHRGPRNSYRESTASAVLNGTHLWASLVMPNDNSDQDFKRSLARAFDRAWALYYRPGRQTLSQDIARTE